MIVMAVARNKDGRLEVFARGKDGALIHCYQWSPNSGFSEWTSLGGGLAGMPAVARNADGRLEVFSLTPDGALWHIWQVAPNSAWSNWASLGGSVNSSPVVARNADGRLEVFCVTKDGALWHRWQTAPSNGWSDWHSLGGHLQIDPPIPPLGDHLDAIPPQVFLPMFDVIPGADGRLELFGIGDDGTLQHIWQMHHRTKIDVSGRRGTPSFHRPWSGWASHGGKLAVALTAPCMHRNADGRLEVFALGADEEVLHIWQTAPNNGWSGWASLGGRILDALSVGRNADGRLELFGRSGDDDAFWHRWQTVPGNGWSDWQSLGGNFALHFPMVTGSFPSVGQNADGRLEVFGKNNNSGCDHNWQKAPNAYWKGWHRLGDWNVITLGRGLREL